MLLTCYLLLTSFSGRGEGFCRAYSVFAVGYEACGWNPATLVLAPDYSFNIATIGLEYNANLRFSDYMRLSELGYWSESDKEPLRNGEDLDFLGSAQAISFSYKNVGVMSYIYSHQAMTLPEEVASLIFWGNEVDSTYSLKGINGRSEIGLTTVLSAAHNIGGKDKIALGGSVKYIYGISYMGIDKSTGYLRTEFYSSDTPKIYGDGKIVSHYAEGGYGLGIDLGAFYTAGNYSLGVSILNVFSQMIWDADAKTVEANFKLDPVDMETFDPETDLVWETVEQVGAFSTVFEPQIDLSVGVKRQKFCLTVGSGYPRLFSIGGEMNYGVLLLRGGCSFEDKRLWMGFGVGVKRNALHIDTGIRLHSTSHLSGGLSISVIPEIQKEKIKKSRVFR
ncbi:MAG: conjugal transfer protein TraF [Candidatus Stahlbacteria bacterium]|nr:conjugal transfer protein TraF [Candidatus Stahlbacteria bacterium]